MQDVNTLKYLPSIPKSIVNYQIYLQNSLENVERQNWTYLVFVLVQGISGFGDQYAFIGFQLERYYICMWNP